MKFLYKQQWNWKISGLALGLTFLLAVLLVKPIGVSTQFVIFDGIVWNLFSDVVVEDNSSKTGYASPNAYLNKSGGKYASNIANPLNYSFVFVLAMVLGGFVASRMQSNAPDADSNNLSVTCDKPDSKRYLTVFLGGALVLFGARLAGGCTSGHMMSGMMQTSLSGYLFAMGAFAVAVPVAMLMYRRKA
ncbi:YeeE/YedE thiosulfate transporter family protein [Endozoicomonadaceae bacterium StTr2]